MRLHEVVDTSREVAATRARNAKIERLAALVRGRDPELLAIVVPWGPGRTATAALVLLQARAVRATEPTQAIAWLRSLPERAPWESALSEGYDGRTRTVRVLRHHAGDIQVVPAGTDRDLVGHTGAITALALGPTGLFSASEDGTVRAWDLATGASFVWIGGTRPLLEQASRVRLDADDALRAPCSCGSALRSCCSWGRSGAADRRSPGSSR